MAEENGKLFLIVKHNGRFADKAEEVLEKYEGLILESDSFDGWVYEGRSYKYGHIVDTITVRKFDTSNDRDIAKEMLSNAF